MKHENLNNILRRLTILIILSIISSFFIAAQFQEESLDLEELEGCTSIQVGRLASTDGSVIIGHSCDGNFRTWLNIVPHKKYEEGTKNQIRWGTMHTETAWDLRGIRVKGEIPQARESYAYMNVSYPCMNEAGLAIGETSIMGRRELVNDEGMFVIEELQRIVLERCTKARDAIRLIGGLVKEYGYGDRGECLTIADSKEVWHFEVMGGGPVEVGAVWAAVRIPDEHVGVSANIPRISELNLGDPDHYMASENVFSLAEEMGWWDPKSDDPFKFWKAYSGRRPYASREFYILSTLAQSLNLKWGSEELPFSVKPDKKVSVRAIMEYYRDSYEGHEFDRLKNLFVKPRKRRDQSDEEYEKVKGRKSPVVNPWLNDNWINLLNTLKPGIVQGARTIAIAQCSYSQIIQCRDWLPPGIGTVAWFAFDNPGQSARIPIFAGITELPKSFKICGQKRFRTDSACWAFRRANRLSQVCWGVAGKYINEAIMEFEDKAFCELPMVEKIALELYYNEDKNPAKYKQYLTKYTNDFARAAMDYYWELGDKFFTMFAKGF